MSQDYFTLNNGVKMPALGIGVFKSSKEDTANAVNTALDYGYRLIDTASVYENEQEVGEGFSRSGLPREEVFITTKIWMPYYRDVRAAFETSRRKLAVDYVDLYLLHWPVPAQFDVTIAAYTEAEKLLHEGKIRALGVSNFNPEHLDALMSKVSVTPAVNQVEIHPFFTQKDVIEANEKHGIITQAWSPLGGIFSSNPNAPKGVSSIFDSEVIKSIAENHNKTPAQVVIKWHLQNKISVIPKSVTPERIKSNFDVFDFELSKEEIALINGLNADLRGGPHPDDLGLDG